MKRNRNQKKPKKPAARPPAPPSPQQWQPRKAGSGFEAHHVLALLLVLVLLIILGGTARMIWQQWQTVPPPVAEAPAPPPKTVPDAVPPQASLPAAVPPAPKPPAPPPLPALPAVADDTIDRALADSGVPANHAKRTWSETRSDAQGNWQYHGYEVTLPPGLTWPAVRSLLVSHLSGKRLSLLEERNAESGTTRIRVAQQSRIIAEAVIRPSEPVPEKVVSNLKGSDPSMDEDQPEQKDTNKQIENQADENYSTPKGVALAQNSPETVPPKGTALLPAPEQTETTEQKKIQTSIPASEAGPVPNPAPPPPHTPAPAPPPSSAPVLVPSTPPVQELPPASATEPVVDPAPPPQDSQDAKSADSPVPVVEAAAAPEQAPMEQPAPEEKMLVASAKDGRPRVAVILDDGGYGGQDTERALSLDPKVTLSILPNTPAARSTAERAVQKGFEVMLHMPMETAVRGIRAVGGQLDTGMTRDTIHRLTLEALAQVPGAKGVNYHTGGKFIQDRKRTQWFMEVVRDQRLYFVDSMTNARSAGHAAAAALGVRNADRDVFLDNQNAPEYIRRQFAQLEDRAKERGAAVGIGHFRRSTISVLHELLPKLRAHGIELVHVSELLP